MHVRRRSRLNIGVHSCAFVLKSLRGIRTRAIAVQFSNHT
jgi:hypothetical protein